MGCKLSTALSVAEDVIEHLQEQQDGKDEAGQQQQSSAAAVSGGSASYVLSSLPPGAETAKVRNVYDGDTLTLVDERRVRYVECGLWLPGSREQEVWSTCERSLTWTIHFTSPNSSFINLLTFCFWSFDK